MPPKGKRKTSTEKSVAAADPPAVPAPPAESAPPAAAAPPAPAKGRRTKSKDAPQEGDIDIQLAQGQPQGDRGRSREKVPLNTGTKRTGSATPADAPSVPLNKGKNRAPSKEIEDVDGSSARSSSSEAAKKKRKKTKRSKKKSSSSSSSSSSSTVSRGWEKLPPRFLFPTARNSWTTKLLGFATRVKPSATFFRGVECRGQDTTLRMWARLIDEMSGDRASWPAYVIAAFLDICDACDMPTRAMKLWTPLVDKLTTDMKDFSAAVADIEEAQRDEDTIASVLSAFKPYLPVGVANRLSTMANTASNQRKDIERLRMEDAQMDAMSETSVDGSASDCKVQLAQSAKDRQRAELRLMFNTRLDNARVENKLPGYIVKDESNDAVSSNTAKNTIDTAPQEKSTSNVDTPAPKSDQHDPTSAAKMKIHLAQKMARSSSSSMDDDDDRDAKLPVKPAPGAEEVPSSAAPKSQPDFTRQDAPMKEAVSKTPPNNAGSAKKGKPVRSDSRSSSPVPEKVAQELRNTICTDAPTPAESAKLTSTLSQHGRKFSPNRGVPSHEVDKALHRDTGKPRNPPSAGVTTVTKTGKYTSPPPKIFSFNEALVRIDPLTVKDVPTRRYDPLTVAMFGPQRYWRPEKLTWYSSPRWGIFALWDCMGASGQIYPPLMRDVYTAGMLGETFIEPPNELPLWRSSPASIYGDITWEMGYEAVNPKLIPTRLFKRIMNIHDEIATSGLEWDADPIIGAFFRGPLGHQLPITDRNLEIAYAQLHVHIRIFEEFCYPRGEMTAMMFVMPVEDWEHDAPLNGIAHIVRAWISMVRLAANDIASDGLNDVGTGGPRDRYGTQWLVINDYPENLVVLPWRLMEEGVEEGFWPTFWDLLGNVIHNMPLRFIDEELSMFHKKWTYLSLQLALDYAHLRTATEPWNSWWRSNTRPPSLTTLPLPYQNESHLEGHGLSFTPRTSTASREDSMIPATTRRVTTATFRAQCYTITGYTSVVSISSVGKKPTAPARNGAQRRRRKRMDFGILITGSPNVFGRRAHICANPTARCH